MCLFTLHAGGVGKEWVVSQVSIFGTTEVRPSGDFAEKIELYYWGTEHESLPMGVVTKGNHWEGSADEDGNPVLRETWIWRVEVSADPASLELSLAWLEGYRPTKESGQKWAFARYYNIFVASIVAAQHFPRNASGEVLLPSRRARRNARNYVGVFWEQEYLDAIFPEKADKRVTIIDEDHRDEEGYVKP